MPVASAPPAVSPRPPAMADDAARYVLDFDPARDGFGFTNSFAWTDDDLAMLADELQPLLRGLTLAGGIGLGSAVAGRRGAWTGLGLGLGAVLGRVPTSVLRRLAHRWPTFGLCGGMALAAVERWPHRAGLPTHQLHREPMRALFRRRQARTIRASGGRFLGYWLAALAGPAYALPFGRALRHEVEHARRRIRAGRPVVLGLVGDTPDPFAMHQVVAFGYEVGGDGATTFSIYDPNTPGQTRRIRAHETEGRVHIGTDLATGPRRTGGYHISRTPGKLSMVFVVDAEPTG